MKNNFLALALAAALSFGAYEGISHAGESPKNEKPSLNSEAAAATAFTSAVYSDKKIKISYPQLKNAGGDRKKSELNALIKTESLKMLNQYEEDVEKLELEADFTIRYFGTNVISVTFSAFAMLEGAAHPVNLIHAVNIDVNSMKPLRLSEVVKIDKSLAEKFIAGKYIPQGDDLDLAASGALKEVSGGLKAEDVLEQFKTDNAVFFFTKDSLALSADVAHVVGDHIEMAIPCEKLTAQMKFAPAGYRDAKVDKNVKK